MNDTAPDTAGPSRLVRILQVLVIVLVFAMVGPPIGGVLLLTLLAIVKTGPGTGASDYVTVVFFALIYGSVFAYLFGIIPAALVGLVVGVRQVYFGRVSLLEALGVGLIAGMVFMIVIFERGPANGSDPYLLRPILVVTCVLPTLVCWLIVRTWFVKPQAGTT